MKAKKLISSAKEQSPNVIQIRNGVTGRHITKNKSLDCNNEDKAIYWRLIYFILIPILCVLVSSSITLLPQHNVVEFPQYFYEFMLILNTLYMVPQMISNMMECKILIKDKSILSFRFFLRFYAASLVGGLIPAGIYHFIWMVCLVLHPPLPLIYLVVGWSIMASNMIYLYFYLIHHVHGEQGGKEKVKKLFLWYVQFFLLSLEGPGITILFSLVSLKIQWIVAFVLPVVRELNSRIQDRIMHNETGFPDEDSKATTNVALNSYYALYVAVFLGTVATTTTGYCILGVDFALNIYSCIKIIKLHRQVQPKGTENLEHQRREELISLILAEILEILVPLSYIATFTTAYYGPNANILGNIRNDYWQYIPVDDPGKLVHAVFQMFLIDFSSAIVGGLLLWKFCSINFVKEICKVMKSHWLLVAIKLSNHLNVVSLEITIE